MMILFTDYDDTTEEVMNIGEETLAKDTMQPDAIDDDS